MIKRLFDVLASFIGLLILLPFFLLLAIWIKSDSKGPVFFLQERIGIHGNPFRLIKFRSMRVNASKEGLLTVGVDHRITNSGKVIRKYKLDELPQLINVLKGDMSFVGPRPEVEKYVALYSEEQKKVLQVKPGITDPASISYMDENELLGNSEQPEETYIQEIMPAKLTINLEYIENRNFLRDIMVILRTIGKLFR